MCVRHGAAVGLRAVLKRNSAAAGGRVCVSQAENESFKKAWIEDGLVRVIFLLGLDRFSDFLSETSVAPVRETVGQVLGTLLRFAPRTAIDSAFKPVLRLLKEDDWSARHGAMIALKYILAVRQDVVASLPREVLPAMMDGLRDSSDDVCAVAAAAVVPISRRLIELEKQENEGVLWKFISLLWERLETRDDLSAATEDCVTSIETFYSDKSVLFAKDTGLPDLTSLLPRVFALFTHPLESVRDAALRLVRVLWPQLNPVPSKTLLACLTELLRAAFVIKSSECDSTPHLDCYVWIINRNPELLGDVKVQLLDIIYGDALQTAPGGDVRLPSLGPSPFLWSESEPAAKRRKLTLGNNYVPVESECVMSYQLCSLLTRYAGALGES